MKNRFSSTRSKGSSPVVEVLLPLLIFIVIIVLFFNGIASISETASEEQLRAAQNAVVRATVQCYALEGQYPPSVAYLRDNYGLSVDEDKYIVHYDVFASNLMPQIVVIPRDSGGDSV